MESFELILILLVCVIVAAIVEQIIKFASLPLVQIGVGLIVAIVYPHVTDIHIESELFLALFIAPLLFNEARESNKRALWSNLKSILSLAIGLVLLTVLVVGFSLHWLVPSIPLAAAFACGAALGPTDAAAVGALGSTISLSKRQKTLLSGESLINDASGVVCFQFATAAALTGAFTLADAGYTFAVLFFGGIVFGIIAGYAAVLGIDAVRTHGDENTVIHVLYEVVTPFIVFVLAETLHVSGILAVVAAGLVMARHTPRLTSSSLARLNLASNSFWEVIVYLINGIIFVMLGTQLPQAMSPTLRSAMSLPNLIGIVLAVTFLVMLVRFIWVSTLELARVDPETSKRGIANVSGTLKDALVTTIAGPKGAVTLSIIFTLPFLMPDGSAFPERELIIFITAGVILCTLLVADLTLAHLSPSETAVDELEVQRATARVLEMTITELESKIAEGTHPEYEPATRMAIGSFRARLVHERLNISEHNEVLHALVSETLEVQARRAAEMQQMLEESASSTVTAPYFTMFRRLRSSLGYVNTGIRVAPRASGLRGKISLARHRLFPKEVSDEKAALMYYRTCLFAIDLERAAIDYLREKEAEALSNEDVRTARIARNLADEHEGIEQMLYERIAFAESIPEADITPDGVSASEVFENVEIPADVTVRIAPIDETATLDEPASENEEDPFGDAPFKLSEQFKLAQEYSDMIYAGALSVELDLINELQTKGDIDARIAQRLREDVYVLQMSLNE